MLAVLVDAKLENFPFVHGLQHSYDCLNLKKSYWIEASKKAWAEKEEHIRIYRREIGVNTRNWIDSDQNTESPCECAIDPAVPQKWN